MTSSTRGPASSIGTLRVGMGRESKVRAWPTSFQRDGACVIRGLLTPDELERLAQGVEENLAAPSERAVEGGGETGTGRFFEDFRNWTRIAAYEEVIRGSRIGAVAARADREPHDPPAPRPPAGQGSRHDDPYAVAPGPAVLRHRRLRHRVALDPARPRPAREHARVRRRVARRRHLVHAARVLRRPPDGVRGGHVRRRARRRGRPRRPHDPRLGARAGRRRRVQHAHAARGGRRAQPAARVLGPA